MTNRREQGSRGESQARSVLEAKGYYFVDSNYYCRWGEIDLIMRDQETLVFVEVRMRKSLRYGSPLESVTRTKQRRLVQSARDYLLRHPYDGPLRFDVVGILAAGEVQVLHIENAIETSSYV